MEPDILDRKIKMSKPLLTASALRYIQDQSKKELQFELLIFL